MAKSGGRARGVTAGPEERREAGEPLVEDDERVGGRVGAAAGVGRGGWGREEVGGGVGHRRQRHGGHRWSRGVASGLAGRGDRWEKSCARDGKRLCCEAPSLKGKRAVEHAGSKVSPFPSRTTNVEREVRVRFFRPRRFEGGLRLAGVTWQWFSNQKILS